MAAPIAFECIRGIGYLLQFAQDKMGNHENAVQKSGFTDVGNSAIDNDAGIEDL
jgi:hypothetical protein